MGQDTIQTMYVPNFTVQSEIFFMILNYYEYLPNELILHKTFSFINCHAFKVCSLFFLSVTNITWIHIVGKNLFIFTIHLHATST